MKRTLLALGVLCAGLGPFAACGSTQSGSSNDAGAHPDVRGGDSGSDVGADAGCGSGKTLCGAACVDEQTDPKNCGGCGLECGTSCSKGECLVTLITTPAGESPWAVALDDTSIYWTALGRCAGDSGAASGLVMKMPLGGGSPTTLATAQGGPAAIAVDATSVYWVNQCPGDGRVMKTDLAGGAATTLASGQSQPNLVAIDATNVYFTTFNPTTTVGSVASVPLEGGFADGGVDGSVGTVTTLASGPTPIAGIAVQGTKLYWAQASPPDNIFSVSTSGGSSKNLTPKSACGGSCAFVAALIADSHSLYWSYLETGSYPSYNLASMPLAGGTPTQLAQMQGVAADLATDSTTLYWSNYAPQQGFGNNDVVSVGHDGGSEVTIASGQPRPRGIAVNGTSVYWANSGTPGAIMKATPK
jgi:hypothetical protein